MRRTPISRCRIFRSGASAVVAGAGLDADDQQVQRIRETVLDLAPAPLRLALEPDTRQEEPGGGRRKDRDHEHRRFRNTREVHRPAEYDRQDHFCQREDDRRCRTLDAGTLQDRKSVV